MLYFFKQVKLCTRLTTLLDISIIFTSFPRLFIIASVPRIPVVFTSSVVTIIVKPVIGNKKSNIYIYTMAKLLCLFQEVRNIFSNPIYKSSNWNNIHSVSHNLRNKIPGYSKKLFLKSDDTFNHNQST